MEMIFPILLLTLVLVLPAARHTMERLDSFVRAVAGKRLTYKALIA